MLQLQYNADFNEDSVANALDLRTAAIWFGYASSSIYDIGYDNIVDFEDLVITVTNHGETS